MEVIALQEYSDKYISLYEGQIRNIEDILANKLIEQEIVAQHTDTTPGQGGGEGKAEVIIKNFLPQGNLFNAFANCISTLAYQTTYNTMSSKNIVDQQKYTILKDICDNITNNYIYYLKMPISNWTGEGETTFLTEITNATIAANEISVSFFLPHFSDHIVITTIKGDIETHKLEIVMTAIKNTFTQEIA